MFSFFTVSREKSGAAIRRFVSPQGIMDLLERKYKEERFSLEKAILIFDTRSQHTWLVSSDKSLVCVVDRRREESPKVLWKIPRDDIVRNGKLSVDIQADDTPDIGYVKIGSKSTRKFSTSLFSAKELKQQIENMLSEETTGHASEVLDG